MLETENTRRMTLNEEMLKLHGYMPMISKFATWLSMLFFYFCISGFLLLRGKVSVNVNCRKVKSLVKFRL